MACGPAVGERVCSSWWVNGWVWGGWSYATPRFQAPRPHPHPPSPNAHSPLLRCLRRCTRPPAHRDHLQHAHPERVDVDGRVVPSLVHFGRHELGRAQHRPAVRRRKAQVPDLDGLALDEDVVALQVAVDDDGLAHDRGGRGGSGRRPVRRRRRHGVSHHASRGGAPRGVQVRNAVQDVAARSMGAVIGSSWREGRPRRLPPLKLTHPHPHPRVPNPTQSYDCHTDPAHRQYFLIWRHEMGYLAQNSFSVPDAMSSVMKTTFSDSLSTHAP